LLSLEGIYDVLTAVEKVAKIPQLKIDQPEGYAIAGMPEELKFHGAEISLARDFILPDMELSLQESLVWEAGSDLQKGAFIASILGHLPLQSGSMRIDGLSLSEWNLMVWRQNINQVGPAGMMENVSLSDYLEVESDSEKMTRAQHYCDVLGISKRLDAFGLTLRDPIYPTWYFNKDLFLWQLGLLRSLINGPKILILDMDSLPQTLFSEVDFDALFNEGEHYWWIFGNNTNYANDFKRYTLSTIMVEKGGKNA